MAKARRGARRAGREQTTTAMLEAAEKLFAERGFTAVSVRDIAAEAGVSHALVHRYLGSKEQVYRAVLAHNEEAIREAAADEAELLTTASLMLREGFAEQRTYLRLVAHSALHGLPYEHTSGRFAATERLVELAQEAAAAEGSARDPKAVDPRFVVASLVALLLGWMATADWVLPAAGITDMAEDEIVDSFEKVVLGILRQHFPGVGGDAAD